MLDQYKKSRKINQVAGISNFLLILLLLFFAGSVVSVRDLGFLLLILIFGLFSFALNLANVYMQSVAMKEIESKLKEGK